MKQDVYYLVPEYRGRLNNYWVRKHGSEYQLYQAPWGGQEPAYLGEANTMLVALARKANREIHE